MLADDKFPIFSHGWILDLSCIADDDRPKGLQFVTIEFVGLDVGASTSSYLELHPSKRTLKVLE